jgi:hypothetical protein
MEPVKETHAHAHLAIAERETEDGPPVGHSVDCPRKGWVHLVECLGCSELTDLEFDPTTNATYVDCVPRADE